jgi:hypothetical protein
MMRPQASLTLNAHFWTVALLCLAGCGASLNGGNEVGKGGSVGTGQGGAGGAGGTGGSSVGPGDCYSAPPGNDPACQPDDSGRVSAGNLVVTPASGDCTAGLTCRFWVFYSTGCDQAVVGQFVCCPAIIPDHATHAVFVPGGTTDDCPKPGPGQDPACALPLASTCPVDGLQCSYRSTSLVVDKIVCCGGVWMDGEVCPADAGMD